MKWKAHRVLSGGVIRLLRLLCLKETLRGQGLAEEDQLELLVTIQVKEVNSLDQDSANKTGDRLSSSVYSFTFGYLSSSFSYPADTSSSQLCGAGSQLFCISIVLTREQCFGM